MICTTSSLLPQHLLLCQPAIHAGLAQPMCLTERCTGWLALCDLHDSYDLHHATWLVHGLPVLHTCTAQLSLRDRIHYILGVEQSTSW